MARGSTLFIFALLGHSLLVSWGAPTPSMPGAPVPETPVRPVPIPPKPTPFPPTPPSSACPGPGQFQCGALITPVCCDPHQTCWVDHGRQEAVCHTGAPKIPLNATSTLQEFTVLSYSSSKFTLEITGPKGLYSANALLLPDPNLTVSWEITGCGRSITEWEKGGNLTLQCIYYEPTSSNSNIYSFTDPVHATFLLKTIPNITMELYPDSPPVQVQLDQVVGFDVIPPQGRHWYPLPGVSLFGHPSPQRGRFGVVTQLAGGFGNFYNVSDKWALNIPQRDPKDYFLTGKTMIVPFLHDPPPPSTLTTVEVQPFATLDLSLGSQDHTAHIGGPLYFNDFLSTNPNSYIIPRTAVVSSRFNDTWMPKHGLTILARLVSSSYRNPEGCRIHTKLPFEGGTILNLTHPVAEIPATYYYKTPTHGQLTEPERAIKSVGITLGFTAPPGYKGAAVGYCQMLFSWNLTSL